MIKWIVISLAALLSVVTIATAALWGGRPREQDKSPDGESRAIIQPLCSMGHVIGVLIATDGPGAFKFLLKKDACDQGDRT